MGVRLRLLRNGLLALWTVTALTIACGDDGNPAAPRAPDAGPDVFRPDPPLPDTVVPSAADVSVYTKTLATLDATASGADSYAWSLVSVPQGSAITIASIESATTAKPTFTPDVSGEYVFELTVTKATARATKEVRVRAVPAPVFYTLSNSKEVPPYAEYRVVGMDGTGGHAVTCRMQPLSDAGDQGQQFGSIAFFIADIGLDWWEAPAGQPSRVTFQQFVFADGGAVDELTGGSLAVATSDSTCQSPPKPIRLIDTTPPDGGSSTGTPMIIQPRFSPDGQRIAYIEQRPAGYYLSAIGYDGNDFRQIASVCPVANATCWEKALWPARPQWVNANTIAWVRTSAAGMANGGDGWELLTATYGATPNPQVYMTCPGYVPFGFAMLADGSVVANRKLPGAPQNLEVLKPTAAGGTCEVVRNLTNFVTPNSYARDFSLSPDRSQIAFIRFEAPDTDAEPDEVEVGGGVFIAAANGATPPVPLTTPAPFALYGPRYIAGGQFIEYNGLKPHPDGGIEDAGFSTGADNIDALLLQGLPAISIVPAQGGAVGYAAVSNLDNQALIAGGGNGGACALHLNLCAVSTPGQSLRGGGAWALVGVVLLLRRHRRTRRRK
jgi:hypothetical protein